MKTTTPWIAAVSAVALALPLAAMADDAGRAAGIARAMSAAPAQVSGAATIVDHHGQVLREGSNGWTCMPSMGPTIDVPMCSDAVWMAFIKALMEKKDPKPTQAGVSYMLAGDVPVNNNDPYDTTQDPGETWVQEGPHIMLIVPNPGTTLAGMTTDPNAGGPYVMWKGTPYEHVMVPTGPRPKPAD